MILFPALFSLLLLVANIYTFVKKKYLYLFVPCMMFLPEFYGISLTDSLPVITVTRIMFVIFYIYAFINRKREISLKAFSFKNISKEYCLLIGYFFLRIVSNLYYVTSYSHAVKTIFAIVFEQILLVLAFYLLKPSKDELLTLGKTVIYTSTVFFILGIIESFTCTRIFDYLYTVNRNMMNFYYIRLGLLRATTSMGLSNVYGNFCLLMVPLILYFFHTTRQKRYPVILFLDFIAIIHSGCRSDIMFYIFILVIYFGFIGRQKSYLIAYGKVFMGIIVATALWVAVFSLADDHYRYYYEGTAKSVLNELGADYDLNANAPDDVDGYGTNCGYGTASRTEQISGLKLALSENLLFGLGAGCQDRGTYQYMHKGKLISPHTIDMGFVEVLACEGIIGFIGFIFLFIFMIRMIIKNYTNGNPVDHLMALLFLSYQLCMLSTVNLYTYLTLYIVLIMERDIIIKENN